MDIIAKEIKNDWKTLSCKLGVNVSAGERILTINKSDEDCLHRSYKKLNYKVLWKELKEYLLQMDRNDVIVLVEKENSITLGNVCSH